MTNGLENGRFVELARNRSIGMYAVPLDGEILEVVCAGRDFYSVRTAKEVNCPDKIAGADFLFNEDGIQITYTFENSGRGITAKDKFVLRKARECLSRGGIPSEDSTKLKEILDSCERNGYKTLGERK